MIKRILLFLSMTVFMLSLTGCGILETGQTMVKTWIETIETRATSPLRGKSTEERILMALEEAYPENDFTIVEPYEDHGDDYYAVCADENGLEFRVDTVGYDNTYHFDCSDAYLQEVLVEQGFVEKAIQIANDNGYEVEYDSQQDYIDIIINISNGDIDLNNAAQTILSILNSPKSIPEHLTPDTGFSTGEVHFYTRHKFDGIGYIMVSDSKDVYLSGGYIRFNERDYPKEGLIKQMNTELQQAYKLDRQE